MEWPVLASGDGSTTAGILGNGNWGIGCFAYAFDDKGKVMPHTSGQFTTHDKDLTDVHLNVLGMNGNSTKVTIQKGTDQYAFKGRMGTGTPKVDTIYPEPAKLVHGQYQPLNGALPNTPAPGLWQFKDGSIFNEKTQNLTFPTKTQSDFSVQHQSGTDEVQLMVSVVKGKDPTIEITKKILPDNFRLGARDNFGSDRFTIDGELRVPAADLDKLAKALAKPEVSVNPSTLHGNGIGMTDTTGQVLKDPQPVELQYYDRDKEKAKLVREEPRFKDLRYSEVKIDSQDNKIHLDVSSYVDPVRSNLDKHFQGEALQEYQKIVQPPVTNNDMLSALRTFALLEKLADALVKQGVPKEKADQLLNDASVQVGDKTIDYKTYTYFQTHYDKPAGWQP